jgi:NADPH-dependent 2,4-dienoyl-CoA reductase/sulfur reductase-like enzyme
MQLPITCALNYETGREVQGPVTVAENKKTVMVIGGGAAGLEAARVAALRGHKVSLYEKNDVLAKDLDIAARAPGRQDFTEAKRYLAYQMKLLNIDVHLGINVTPEMVIRQQPDSVIVATGGLPFIPEIPGSENSHVVGMKDVLTEEVEVGQNVLVVDYQHHLYGLDTADFLAERGKKVELITDVVCAGTEVDAYTIDTAYLNALSRGVVITPLTGLKEVNGKTATVYHVITNIERQIEGIDTIVICTDEKANDTLYYALKGQVKELHLVGQALSPRKLLDSIADAYVAASAL